MDSLIRSVSTPGLVESPALKALPPPPEGPASRNGNLRAFGASGARMRYDEATGPLDPNRNRRWPEWSPFGGNDDAPDPED
jgi:hypothetical protein